MLRVVLWWSLFVAITGFVGTTSLGGVYLGFTALIVIQFFFGVGEAGAFPNIAKALYNWFPASQRGFAKSIIWMSARFLGGLTPLIWVLHGRTGRRLTLAPGDVGVRRGRRSCGACSSSLYFRNSPGEHPAVMKPNAS